MSKKFVLIDSGHNKLTAGKRSPDGSLFEYEFNFDVSCRLQKILERHGVKAEVQQIEIKDSNKELNERVNRVNRLKPDVVISIHANAFGTSFNDANGWEIYSYQSAGASYELAKAIEKESIPYLGIRDRGVKDGINFAMIRRTFATAVIVEHGFYTNKKECKLLKSDEYRQKCAIADAKGILAYFGIAWIEESGYRDKVQERFGFDDNTMKYLEEYKYGEALLKRLAETD